MRQRERGNRRFPIFYLDTSNFVSDIIMNILFSERYLVKNLVHHHASASEISEMLHATEISQ